MKVRPEAEALREPTMATAGRARMAAGPRSADEGRRRVDRLQGLRIIGFAHGDEADAEPRRRPHLRLRLGDGRDLDDQPPSPPGEVRQRLERRSGAAVAVDQGAEGARPDIFGPDQPEPVEALRVGEESLRLLPIFPSVPARSRLMFSLCFHQSRSVSTTRHLRHLALADDHRIAGVAALATRDESDE